MAGQSLKARIVTTGYAGLGLIIAGIIAGGALPLLFDATLGWFWYLTWWPQIIVGAGVSLLTAWLMAPTALQAVRRKRNSFLPIGIAIATFLLGLVAAGGMSLLVFDASLTPGSLRSYVVMPLYWFTPIGIPCSAILGFLLGRSLLRVAEVNEGQ